jgi:hypothetical protein
MAMVIQQISLAIETELKPQLDAAFHLLLEGRANRNFVSFPSTHSIIRTETVVVCENFRLYDK